MFESRYGSDTRTGCGISLHFYPSAACISVTGCVDEKVHQPLCGRNVYFRLCHHAFFILPEFLWGRLSYHRGSFSEPNTFTSFLGMQLAGSTVRDLPGRVMLRRE